NNCVGVRALPGGAELRGRCARAGRDGGARRVYAGAVPNRKEPAMKNGFRVFDVDTHIYPGAAVLDRYVDPGFRPRLPALAPYKVAIRGRDEGAAAREIYRFAEKAYERTLGEAAPRPGSRDGRVWRGRLRPRPGVEDDNAANRLADMDVEGADRHFLVPS